MTLEAAPASSKFDIKGSALYTMGVTPAPNNVTSRRMFINGDILVPPAEYAGLRSFYSQLEAKDQESIVLKQVPVESSSITPPATASH